jgi:hypothetical protein
MVLSVRRPLRQNISVERISHASSVHGTFMAEVGGSRRWWKEKSERRGSAVLVWSVPPSPVQLQCPTCDDEQRCLPTSRTRCPCTGVIATSGARRSGRLACDRAPFTQSCSCLRRCSHHGRMHRGVSFAGSARLLARDPVVPVGVVPGRRGPRRRLPPALLPLIDFKYTSLTDSGLTPAWTIMTSQLRAAQTSTLGRVRVHADPERGQAMNGTSASNWPP